MSRYINTDVFDIVGYIVPHGMDFDSFEAGVNHVMNIIHNTQTADVVEVKHGSWKYLYDGNYKCSECGSWWCCTDSQIDEMNYCPNCGAKMDEREDEQ